jgi:cobaltochelatase CobN
MHVVFRETHGMEETAVPQDLGQEPADLVVLSFSDSDLSAFAAAWRQMRDRHAAFPELRLANLAALTHPLSVDTYVERTLSGAKAILIRLIGGASYWSYGLQQVELLARSRGIALAVLPGDGIPDARLDAASTMPVLALRDLARLCEAGGAAAAQTALGLLANTIGWASGPEEGGQPLPMAGFWHPARGVLGAELPERDGRPLVLIVFYRSYLTADDLDPFVALHAALDRRGCDTLSIFVSSLKAPDVRGQVQDWVRALTPAAIINATAFSARDERGDTPLDGAGTPVFQVALATSGRTGWEASSRGLSPADLAMHVVLPEIDGRLLAGVASFKQTSDRDPALGFSRSIHRADAERVDAIAAKVAGWIALAHKPASARRLALVLSTYPGKAHQMAHAVGLDALASAQAMLCDLADAGYATEAPADLTRNLQRGSMSWPLADYRRALADLPPALQADLAAAWGEPEDDTAVVDGAFRFPAVELHNAIISLQPERGVSASRDETYHDLSRCPRHGYVAFYLWLRVQRIDAMVHVGAHGTLEWLPGKAVALSDHCWPEALTGPLPVIYPFIVNDPGEAAQAKRRIGAVTLGHAPPPLAQAGQGAGLGRLETMLDEFSNAGGLDPARRDRLQDAIRTEAQALGLEAELGLDKATTLIEAITRIDRFVCDVKESQFGDGLHVFGRGEADACRRALRALRPVAGQTCCRRGGTSTPSIHARCLRAPPMPMALCLPRNSCGGTCRTTATIRVGCWSICGARPRCARRARNLPWRFTCLAPSRCGTWHRNA